MNLTYNEILKLKGKVLENTNSNSAEFGRTFKVTSSTNKNVVLNNGTTIKTTIFFETRQNDFKLLP